MQCTPQDAKGDRGAVFCLAMLFTICITDPLASQVASSGYITMRAGRVSSGRVHVFGYRIFVVNVL